MSRPAPRPRVRAATLPFLGIALALAGPAAACTPGAPTAPHPADRQPNEVILAWSTAAHDAMVAHDGYVHSLFGVRAFAMMHIAQHDALAAIAPVYAPHTFQGRDSTAHPVAAAAAAAHGVLAAVFPAQRAAFDMRLAESLASVPDGEAETRGVALGAQAAAAVVAARAQDGADTPPVGGYVPGAGAGRYQFTPGFDFAFAPGWRQVRPFAVVAANQFRPGPPPALTSAGYAAALNEVKALGRKESTVRTPAQSASAKFWYEDSDRGWNRIARAVAAEQKLGLLSTARLFALLNMSMSDAYVAGWDAKYHYDLWRPVTAIRAADADGNSATAPDPAWEPAEPTPPVPDYPSTHSALGNAAAEVLAHVFGDRTRFTFASTTGDPATATRTFPSFSAAADENANSRLVGGLHFRFACDAGQALGRNIGRWAVAHHLARR